MAGDKTMRVMVLVKATKDSEAGAMPSTELLVKELTDLPQDDRAHVFEVLCATETALRELLSPDKMNIAALGTAMPHLHWHVVPRYAGDTHFPEPIWSTPLRDVTERKLPHGFAEDLVVALRSRL